MRVQFLGTGDAFGSGGRFNTCFLVDRGARKFLIDCGASAMIAMRKFGVDPNAIDAIVLSHLHGDHFGGLPFFILDAQFVSRRRAPLVIAGPQGLATRLETLMEAMFPGMWEKQREFPIALVEIEAQTSTPVGPEGPRVTGFPVKHPSGATSFALRIDCDGKTIAFTGDTEWVDILIEVGRDADLFISECYMDERAVPNHLSFATLKERLPECGARRIVLTHMPAEMLQLRSVAPFERAEDGMEITI